MGVLSKNYLIRFAKKITLAGIYIHIPFCKQACYYCDFHFSTSLKNRNTVLEAIQYEIYLQKDYLNNESIDSIYFGGGTPSLLEERELSQIIEQLYKHFQIGENIEITLEANPDDLDLQKIKSIRRLGINRLSIGIQSFHDPHLQFMNRAHNSIEAQYCVSNAIENGINDISIDLIYGIPSEDHSIWQADISKALEFPINHISAYCLTIEPKTVFGKRVSKQRMMPIDDEFAAEQFEVLIDQLSKSEFEQYEISNFCRGGHYSKHNSSYWQQRKYLGIGPSAHSFDGLNRQFNIANNTHYVRAINDHKIPCTVESLSATQKANEYLLITLRTKWGSELYHLTNIFPGWINLFEREINQMTKSGYLTIKDNTIFLSAKGKLIADEITLKLFIDEK